MAGDTKPTETLPPTQYLVLEVLAARYRLGETHWTFPKRLRVTLHYLGAAGLIGWKYGPVYGTCVAWLTEEGRKAALSEDYTPPARPQIHVNYGPSAQDVPGVNATAMQEAYALGRRHGRQGR